MRTGVPCNENRFFPVRIYYTGKTLFWPCTGPVRNYSVYQMEYLFLQGGMIMTSIETASVPNKILSPPSSVDSFLNQRCLLQQLSSNKQKSFFAPNLNPQILGVLWHPPSTPAIYTAATYADTAVARGQRTEAVRVAPWCVQLLLVLLRLCDLCKRQLERWRPQEAAYCCIKAENYSKKRRKNI